MFFEALGEVVTHDTWLNGSIRAMCQMERLVKQREKV